MNSKVQVNLSPQTGKGIKLELISSCLCTSVAAACQESPDSSRFLFRLITGLQWILRMLVSSLPSKYICAHDCDHTFVMGWLNWFNRQNHSSLVSMRQLGRRRNPKLSQTNGSATLCVGLEDGCELPLAVQHWRSWEHQHRHRQPHRDSCGHCGHFQNTLLRSLSQTMTLLTF